MRLQSLSALAILILTLVCDAVLLGAPAEWGQLAGLVLVCALPGAALLLALPSDTRPRDWLERVLLAFGLSVVLSMLCFWLAAQLSGFGIISRWLVVESLLIMVLVGIGIWRAIRPSRTTHHAPRTTFHPSTLLRTGAPRFTLLALVLLVAALLRFTSLGYGEFYDDELDVVQSARSMLLGQTNVVFEHRKGPTEIWFAAVAAGTSTRFDEATMRLPFVLVSLGAIAATTMLGDEVFGKWRGLLAGLVLSGEGIFLAFSRMVQYQAIVLLMIVLAVWCALRFWRAQTPRSEIFYLAVGALCWSFGMLTHWDGVVIGVVLAWVVMQKWITPLSLPGRGVGGEGLPTRLAALWLISTLAVAIPAIFYLQLFLNPKIQEAKPYYGERIGFGIFNGVPAFMLHATFYDASPFIVVLLVSVAWFLARHLPRWRPAPRIGGVLALGLMLMPFLWPDFLQIGAWNFSLFIFIAILIMLLRSRTLTLEVKTLFTWLLVYFVVYAFVIKSAGLHFYTLMPALALLASLSILPNCPETRLTPHASRLTFHPSTHALHPAGQAGFIPAPPSAGAHSARRGHGQAVSRFTFYVSRFTPSAFRLVLFATLLMAYAYDYIAYIREQPEYALRYPQTALAIFPTLYRERPKDFFFGFPYRYGWSVIGELYRQGILRGKFESNETYLVTDWYARDLEVARDDEPRYYLRVDDSPRGGDVPGDLSEKFHPWGEVRVHSETKIQIFESHRYASSTLRVFNAEGYPTSDPQFLARSMTYKQAHGDDRAFRELGRYLDINTNAQDLLVLDTPLQDGIIPYYYRGPLRIMASSDEAALWQAAHSSRTIYASLWAPSKIEHWLAHEMYPLESQWFGSVRLSSYAPPLPHVTILKSGAWFGESARLLTYDIEPHVVHSGDVLQLNLQWQASAPLAARYKVFVHVLDQQGKVIAQRDSEPTADLRPTTTWKASETIEDLHGVRLPANLLPQKLRLAIGLYDPITNARLPVRDANGTPQPDGRLLIEGPTVQ